jgi:pyruvate/2-oxoglutarate/acetoin dehydrogenase E1 component
MRSWIIENALYKEDELSAAEDDLRKLVNQARIEAWKLYDEPIQQRKKEVLPLLEELAMYSDKKDEILILHRALLDNNFPFRRDVVAALQQSILIANERSTSHHAIDKLNQLHAENKQLFNSHLYFNPNGAVLSESLPIIDYTENAPSLNGYEILNHYFNELFSINPLVVAFGEDLGRIGDVNQGFAGLQLKYGETRIFDTGIRELTIIGQGLGMSMRGLKPIAEIQYLDYLLYGLQVLSDDVSTLHYRTAGRQIAPLIVRTRGHRLEGIWHSGSPMGMMLSALKGMHICVPRNMVQAVGFYNTLLEGKDPGIVIECLNGYRLKEKLPNNLVEYKIPLGMPEVIRQGADITVVSYGSTLRIISEAADFLSKNNIDVEIVDVQTLLPFDVHAKILDSLKKTNRILFVDEDVPGGATSFMFTEILEHQGGYRWLDAAPRILCAKPHRPAYGSDGDYFSKPNVEDVINMVMSIMSE